MKMKAAVLRRFDAPQPFANSKPISIEEVTIDPPGPNEVLVSIGGAGLCHSDLSVMNGARPRPEPLVLGHETFATVTAEICRVNEGSSRPACQLTSSGEIPVSNSPRNRHSNR